MYNFISNKQKPCVSCGKDSFIASSEYSDILRAAKCLECLNIFCQKCIASTNASNNSQVKCPACNKTHIIVITLNNNLINNSIRCAEDQSLDGWPDLNKVIYSKMLDEAKLYLPILKACCKDLIREESMVEFEKKFCLASCIAAYMSWSFNRHPQIRDFIKWSTYPDFETPDIKEISDIILRIITKSDE